MHSTSNISTRIVVHVINKNLSEHKNALEQSINDIYALTMKPLPQK